MIAAALITIILMMDSPPLQIAAPPKRPNFGPLSRAIPVRATVAQTPLVSRDVEVWKRFLRRPDIAFPHNLSKVKPGLARHYSECRTEGAERAVDVFFNPDRKRTRLNSSHDCASRMPSSS